MKNTKDVILTLYNPRKERKEYTFERKHIEKALRYVTALKNVKERMSKIFKQEVEKDIEANVLTNKDALYENLHVFYNDLYDNKNIHMVVTISYELKAIDTLKETFEKLLYNEDINEISVSYSMYLENTIKYIQRRISETPKEKANEKR